jgi:acyl carrier protein
MSEEAFLDDLAAIFEVDIAELHGGFILDKSNWDSLAIVAVIVLIDEQYGITIEGDKLRECSSINALLQLINDAHCC